MKKAMFYVIVVVSCLMILCAESIVDKIFDKVYGIQTVNDRIDSINYEGVHLVSVE